MEPQLETCEDCNWYDDVTKDDTFLYSFGYPGDGTQYWLCGICAESREYVY